jgi:hypothetical protein
MLMARVSEPQYVRVINVVPAAHIRDADRERHHCDIVPFGPGEWGRAQRSSRRDQEEHQRKLSIHGILQSSKCSPARPPTLEQSPIRRARSPRLPPRLQLRPYPLHHACQPFGSTSSASLCHSLASVPLRFVSRVCGRFPVLATRLGSAEELRCKVWHSLRKTARAAGGSAPIAPPARLGALRRRNQRYKLVVAKQRYPGGGRDHSQEQHCSGGDSVTTTAPGKLRRKTANMMRTFQVSAS